MCRHGESCRYAHAECELRRRPDGSWDPTSSVARAEAGLSSLKESAMETVQNVQSVANPLQKCILDLPLKWTSEDLDKLLAEKVGSFSSRLFLPLFCTLSTFQYIWHSHLQGISFRSSRKRPRSSVGFIEFESDEHIALAKQVEKGDSMHIL